MKIIEPIRDLQRRGRGMTLVELMLSLTILSILSIGAFNMINAGLHVDRVMLDSDRQVSETELAIRRMTHFIRTGSGLTLSGTTGLTLTSEADPNNNGRTYTITYSYDSSAQTLSESSTQYGATPPVNVIAYNVSAFSITQASASPVVISIDITVAPPGTSAPTRRTFQVLNRNS